MVFDATRHSEAFLVQKANFKNYAVFLCLVMFVSNVCRNFHFVVWLAWKFQFHVLQNQIDILIYSCLCICLESIHGIRRSVSVDLCNFFHTCCQGGWIPICYPLFRILSGLFFPIKGSLFWLIIFVCLCEENFFFVSDILGRCGDFDTCCSDIFQDFET